MFCFGCNGVEVLRARCESELINVVKAELKDHARCFAGSAPRWEGGGVASCVVAAREAAVIAMNAKSRDPPGLRQDACRIRGWVLPRVRAMGSWVATDAWARVLVGREETHEARDGTRHAAG